MKVGLLREEELKSAQAKENWRPFCENYKLDVEDYNYGSIFKKFKETGEFDKNEIYPYITEGIGEDFLPQNVAFDLIDHFEKVTDKDAAVMTRRIPREEGIFAGNSAGSAMAGLLQMKSMFKEGDLVVVIFHDHGTRYLGKMFNEEWMQDRGFLPKEPTKTALDLIQNHKDRP